MIDPKSNRTVNVRVALVTTRKQPAPTAGRRHLRADAERSIEAILDATLGELATTGDANMAAIARAAGVSRVTLYSHFPTRENLVERTVARAIADARQVFAELDLVSGPAPEVLAALLGSNWETLNRYRNLYAAAVRMLPPGRFKALHDPLFGPIKALVSRGQSEGDFRTDLPLNWLVATIYGLMHQGAQEVNARRRPATRAAGVVTETVLSAITARC